MAIAQAVTTPGMLQAGLLRLYAADRTTSPLLFTKRLQVHRKPEDLPTSGQSAGEI